MSYFRYNTFQKDHRREWYLRTSCWCSMRPWLDYVGEFKGSLYLSSNSSATLMITACYLVKSRTFGQVAWDLGFNVSSYTFIYERKMEGVEQCICLFLWTPPRIKNQLRWTIDGILQRIKVKKISYVNYNSYQRFSVVWCLGSGVWCFLSMTGYLFHLEKNTILAFELLLLRLFQCSSYPSLS